MARPINKKAEKAPESTESEREIVQNPEDTFRGWYRDSLHTGSRVICNPPPTDTDDDYLFLLGEGTVQALEAALVRDNWKLGGSFGTKRLSAREDIFDPKNFSCWRKGDKNLILTCSDEYFTRFSNATMLAKKLNLLKKEDRVTLFEAIVRDNYPNESTSEVKTGRWWNNAFIRAANRVNNVNDFIPADVPNPAEEILHPDEIEMNRRAMEVVRDEPPLRAIDVVERLAEAGGIRAGDMQVIEGRGGDAGVS